jgi:hypothetical protein
VPNQGSSGRSCTAGNPLCAGWFTHPGFYSKYLQKLNFIQYLHTWPFQHSVEKRELWWDIFFQSWAKYSSQLCYILYLHTKSLGIKLKRENHGVFFHSWASPLVENFPMMIISSIVGEFLVHRTCCLTLSEICSVFGTVHGPMLSQKLKRDLRVQIVPQVIKQNHDEYLVVQTGGSCLWLKYLRSLCSFLTNLHILPH